MKSQFKKTITLFIFCFIFCKSLSQEKISVMIAQDLKLAVIGDDKHNYDAFTTNLVMRLKMTGKQQKWGYMTIFPELEYADLRPKYWRYSVNVGYTFNKMIVDIMPYVSYGKIVRSNTSATSIGGGLEIGYNINRTFKIVAQCQLNERSDLKVMYGDNSIMLSNFVGIEFIF